MERAEEALRVFEFVPGAGVMALPAVEFVRGRWRVEREMSHVPKRFAYFAHLFALGLCLFGSHCFL